MAFPQIRLTFSLIESEAVAVAVARAGLSVTDRQAVHLITGAKPSLSRHGAGAKMATGGREGGRGRGLGQRYGHRPRPGDGAALTDRECKTGADFTGPNWTHSTELLRAPTAGTRRIATRTENDGSATETRWM